jgi:quinol-cytochrome oxidoreductase complex cytochrome b subunit
MRIGKKVGDWFDERLGTRAVGQALFGRKIPLAKGPIAWIYTLGSVVLFLFILQMMTGIFLAMNYVPSPDHAYDAIHYITDQAPLGAFVRGLHHWGASAMVVAIGLHLITVFFTGGYKYPREATWVTGACLFVIVLLFAFTGYLLPWNEKAYWATVVGTNLAGEAPIIGPTLDLLLRGSHEIGAQTLTRFYALHVLLLPALLAAFLVAHLFMVVRQGISPPPERREVPEGANLAEIRAHELERYQALKEAGEAFYPYYLFKDAVAVLTVFLIVAFLAWRFPPGVGTFPNPTDTNYNPRPEWYFLFLFQFLKYFPGRLEPMVAVVLPSGAILFLLLFPFFDRRLQRHPLNRPIASIAAIAAVAAFVFLTIRGAESPPVSAYVPEPPLVVEGGRLFRQLHCEYCHSVNGVGGHVGPDLALSIHAEHDRQWVLAHLEEPGNVVAGKTSPMGVLPALTKGQQDALFAYIEELRGGGPYSPLAPVLVKTYCMGCHRLHGEGGTFGPDLSSIGLLRSVSFIDRYVEDPKAVVGSAQMPAYLTPKGPLTAAQIEDVARYLAKQRGSRQPGPAVRQDQGAPSNIETK